MSQNGSTLDSVHANVEGVAGATVTYNDGTTDSRALARDAYAAGSISQAVFVARMTRLEAYEQIQFGH
jgi:hypothetical protein